MTCTICKRTEEELRDSTLQEITNIDKVISIIEAEIDNEMTSVKTGDTMIIDRDSGNCMGKTDNYCQDCLYCESVDDIDYFWCNKYKKTFTLLRNDSIKQLKKDIGILKFKRKEIQNRNLKLIKMGFTDENYRRIMTTYLSDYSSFFICEDCNLLLDKLIEHEVSERMHDLLIFMEKIYGKRFGDDEA
jgi:hypothetical protein